MKPLLSMRLPLTLVCGAGIALSAAGNSVPSPVDPDQVLERTCFQTGRSWDPRVNLRSDVAIVYGIDTNLPARIESWREQGYRIHVMTGVAWGAYQDYLYGRFDGTNHEDEAQTDRNGRKIGHGGDVYYMSPGVNYGKFLCVGVQRAKNRNFGTAAGTPRVSSASGATIITMNGNHRIALWTLAGARQS